MKLPDKARSFVFLHATPILIGFLALFVLVRMPVFFRPDNLISLSSQATVFGMVAIGMTMLIMTGVTDISVGAQIYLGGIVAVRIFQLTGSMLVATLASIAVCMVVSSVNGITIAKIGLPSMVATLAMQQICNGLASILVGEDSVINMPEEFRILGQGKVFSVPVSVVIFLGLFALGVLVMGKTKFGRYVYAAGNSIDAAGASGINVFLVRESIFLITGALAGFAGAINASRIGGVQFGMAAGMEFSCIAAVVVGGTSMLGGSGRMIGTLMGIAVIASIDQLLRLFNVSIYLYNVFWGGIVLFTVCMDLLRKSEQRRLKERKLAVRVQAEEG